MANLQPLDTRKLVLRWKSVRKSNRHHQLKLNLMSATLDVT